MDTGARRRKSWYKTVALSSVDIVLGNYLEAQGLENITTLPLNISG